MSGPLHYVLYMTGRYRKPRITSNVIFVIGRNTLESSRVHRTIFAVAMASIAGLAGCAMLSPAENSHPVATDCHKTAAGALIQ